MKEYGVERLGQEVLGTEFNERDDSISSTPEITMNAIAFKRPSPERWASRP